MSNDILQHYGVKGQKWGVRRYQNPDGSLTPEGRRRYNKTDDYIKRMSSEQLEKKTKRKRTENGYRREKLTEYKLKKDLYAMEHPRITTAKDITKKIVIGSATVSLSAYTLQNYNTGIKYVDQIMKNGLRKVPI